MALRLYRRHIKTCTVHQSGTPARARRYYTDCECPIWITGTTDSTIMPRQSTGLTDWKAAEALMASQVAGSKDAAIHGPRIDDCIRQYLSSRTHQLSHKTLRYYTAILGQLQAYNHSRGRYFMSELTTDNLEAFKTEGMSKELKDTSKSTATKKLLAFLRTSFRRGWIDIQLADRVTGHAAMYEQKMPFSKTEVKLILAECLNLSGGTHGYASKPPTFQLLIRLMAECGLRVSDAVRFDPSMLIHGDAGMIIYPFVMVKRKKTERPRTVEAYLFSKLAEEIKTCKWMSPTLPFWCGNNSETSVWHRMQTVGKRCGVTDCRPHRLRDFFAVKKLLNGLSLEDVSRLLGHSSVAVTQAHYAPWIPARTRRLERLLAESISDTDRD
jgi:integrase/recombinase XerD